MISSHQQHNWKPSNDPRDAAIDAATNRTANNMATGPKPKRQNSARVRSILSSIIYLPGTTDTTATRMATARKKMRWLAFMASSGLLTCNTHSRLAKASAANRASKFSVMLATERSGGS